MPSRQSVLDSLGFGNETETLPPSSNGSAPQPEFSLQDVSVSAAEAAESARTNLNFLAALATPEIFKYNFPPVFLAVWSWLLHYVGMTRDFSRLVLGLPRGFGKTIIIKLFVLFCVLFTDRRFILIISENEKKAINILSDISDMLDEPNIKRIFGDWRVGLQTDQQALKKFGFRGRNIILMAAGAGTGIRGITIKNERPDVMIFDDIQSRECANSEVESTTLETWLHGTAMKAKSPIRCLYIFVGNMYPTKHSILRKLKYNPTWVKFIAGGILADGTSLWEELQPIAQLMTEFENDVSSGHPEIFYSEVLNDENASVNNLVDISKLPAYPFKDDDISAGGFLVIDPATDKPGADAVSIGAFEIHNALPCLVEVEEGSYSPGETIKRAISMSLRRRIGVVAIESNAYQYTLKYWFEFICLQMGIIGIDAVEVYSGGYSKNSRILSMFKSLQAAEIYYHPRTAPLVNLQISQFNPLKRDNTDGILDLLTYSPQVIEMYGDVILSKSVIESQEFNSLGVVSDNTFF